MSFQRIFQAKPEPAKPLQTKSLFAPRPVPFQESAQEEAAFPPIHLGQDHSAISFKPVRPAPALGPSSISCPFTPERCPFGGACHACPPKMQAKLKIGQPGDSYEQEADRVAEQVMRMPEPQAQRKAACASCADKDEDDKLMQTKPLAEQITPLVQRKPGLEAEKKDEDDDELLQAKSASGIGNAQEVHHPLIQSVLSSPGQPLDAGTRSFMEPRFGQDFSGVRVHVGGQAAESARAVNARAYTVGRDVVFGEGQYAPGSDEGKRLVAHELVHVGQQGKSRRERSFIFPYTDPAPLSIQRQEHSSEDRYTITLHTDLSIENAQLDRAQRFLRSQLLGRLRGYAEGKRETHLFLANLRQENFINEYFVAPVAETLGGVELPPLGMWTEVFRLIDAVEAAINAGQIEQALRAAVTAEESYARASRRVDDYRNGIESGGERAVTGLEFVRNASVVIVGAAATVATGGLAAGAAVGTGYGTALTITQQATEVGLGLRQYIDWERIAFDTLFNFVLSYAGGRIGGAIAGRIIGSNPAAASMGRAAVARIISNVIVGRGSAAVNVAAQSVYDLVRGQPITPEQFADRLAEQLFSVRGAFMDVVYGEIANAAVGRATRPRSSDGAPVVDIAAARARPEPAARARRQAAQENTRTGQRTSSRRTGRSLQTDSSVVDLASRRQQAATQSRALSEGNLALQQPEFIPEPTVEPAISEPEPAQVIPFPTTATGQGRASSTVTPGQATGVGLGAAATLRTVEEQASCDGLSPHCPLPFIWYKPNELYAPELNMPRAIPPTTISRGDKQTVGYRFQNRIVYESLGVKNWPSLGKRFQFFPYDMRTTPEQARFNRVLDNVGFNRAGFDAEHVWDVYLRGLTWDRFSNLWPASNQDQQLAGTLHRNQIRHYEALLGNVTGRWFRINQVRHPAF